ncbi:MAG: hypothetical protein IJX62_01400 [Clostridia bacterium]|nr:hypothetical protein [Clostridia bacterium]
MYVQYAPVLPKKREKRLFAGLLLLSVGLIAASLIPSVYAPHLLRALTAVCLLLSAMIFSRCLMRRYVYRVEPCTAEGMGDSRDFTVTEYAGSRCVVVCRISVCDVESAELLTAENRRRLLSAARGFRIYAYTGTLFPVEEYLLRIVDGGEKVYLKIEGNAALIRSLLTS